MEIYLFFNLLLHKKNEVSLPSPVGLPPRCVCQESLPAALPVVRYTLVVPRLFPDPLPPRPTRRFHPSLTPPQQRPVHSPSSPTPPSRRVLSDPASLPASFVPALRSLGRLTVDAAPRKPAPSASPTDPPLAVAAAPVASSLSLPSRSRSPPPPPPLSHPHRALPSPSLYPHSPSPSRRRPGAPLHLRVPRVARGPRGRSPSATRRGGHRAWLMG